MLSRFGINTKVERLDDSGEWLVVGLLFRTTATRSNTGNKKM